ncbi:MAG: GLPGLI family protein, partial [Capnocytophaga sp.]|nr:GLPGLI family protein [Capnocytophaga sp.]
MNNKYIVLVFIIFISTFLSQAQSGIITYSGHMSQRYSDSVLEVRKNDKTISPHELKKTIQTYNAAKPIELELRFKDNESFYEMIPDLNSDGSYNMSETLTGGYMPYYMNSKSNTIIEFNPFVGNTVIDQPLEWNITTETKKIGKYNCTKAVAYERLPSRKGGFFTDKVIAWFTAEIPVNFAPRRYNGLPGLVLE